MELRKIVFVTLWCLILASREGNQALAAVEHVSKQQIESIKVVFDRAQSNSGGEIASETVLKLSDLVNKTFVCDMIGVSSRMQVEKNIKLYRFGVIDNKGELANNGAHFIRAYTSSGKFLRGQKGNLVDEIRAIGPDAFVVRLSIHSAPSAQASKETPSEPRVLAYSRCVARQTGDKAPGVLSL